MANPRQCSPAGFIFGCNNATEDECRTKQLFGLPAAYKDAVSAIFPGTTLFLYNYDRRILYGVFYACSQGGWNLDPVAFGGEFPSQIRVQGIETWRHPAGELRKPVFKEAILDNFRTAKLFSYELNQAQVSRLLVLYSQNHQQSPIPPANASSIRQGLMDRRQVARGRSGQQVSRSTPASQGQQGQKRQLPLFTLSPSSPPPRRGRQRRHFGVYAGYKVEVENTHPITHDRPPDRTPTPQSPRSFSFSLNASEDSMDFEMEELNRSGPVTEPESAFQSNLPRPLTHFAQHETVMAPMDVPTQTSFRTPTRSRQPLKRQEAQKHTNHPSPSSPIVSEQQWKLGEAVWADAQSFNAFISGEEQLPQQPCVSSSKTSTPLKHDHQRTAPQYTAGAVTEAKQEPHQDSLESSQGHGSNREVDNFPPHVQRSFSGASHQEIISAAQQNDSVANVSEENLAQVTDIISQIFQSIGYAIDRIELPAMNQVVDNGNVQIGIAIHARNEAMYESEASFEQ